MRLDRSGNALVTRSCNAPCTRRTRRDTIVLDQYLWLRDTRT